MEILGGLIKVCCCPLGIHKSIRSDCTCMHSRTEYFQLFFFFPTWAKQG